MRRDKMKFTLEKEPAPYGTLTLIFAVQYNDEGKLISKTKVGYIDSAYENRLKFKELSD